MKTLKLMPLLMATLMVVLLASCGPSYVGVNSRPAYGYYGRPNPYYGGYGGYGYYNRPYGYYRPPVVVQRRTYITPAPRYNAPRNYAPNGRIGGGGRFNGGGGGRSRGPR
jgi:hypothetical protein